MPFMQRHSMGIIRVVPAWHACSVQVPHYQLSTHTSMTIEDPFNPVNVAIRDRQHDAGQIPICAQGFTPPGSTPMKTLPHLNVPGCIARDNHMGTRLTSVPCLCDSQTECSIVRARGKRGRQEHTCHPHRTRLPYRYKMHGSRYHIPLTAHAK